MNNTSYKHEPRSSRYCDWIDVNIYSNKIIVKQRFISAVSKYFIVSFSPIKKVSVIRQSQITRLHSLVISIKIECRHNALRISKNRPHQTRMQQQPIGTQQQRERERRERAHGTASPSLLFPSIPARLCVITDLRSEKSGEHKSIDDELCTEKQE